MAYPFVNLTSTSTFTQWFTQTNELTTFLNSQVIANGVVAYGDFEIGVNASLVVCNTIFANSTLLAVLSDFGVGDTGTITTFLGEEFNVAANTILLNPISSIFVNTALTVNAVASFLANVAVANLTLSGTLVGVAARFDGNITANNGTLIARSLSLTTNGATVNSTLSAAGYADYATAGIEDAQVWFATPTTNTVVSGLDAHAAVTSSVNGARYLFLQNGSSTKKITLSCANTSSTAAHRFEGVSGLDVDVLPLQTVLLIYAKDNTRWRVVGGSQTIGGATAFGNTTITGTFSVTGNTTLTANLTILPLFVDYAATRVGIGTLTPSAMLHSVGPNLLEDITTMVQARATSLVVSGSANLASANVRVAANGATTFDSFINVLSAAESYVQNLRVGAFQSNSSIVGVSISGVTGVFSGAVSGTTGTFTGAVSVGGNLTPTANAQGFGSATKLWLHPFVGLNDGSADAAMVSAVITGATGELKTQPGFTGTRTVQTNDGQKLFTWNAGVLVSVGA